MSDEQLRRRLRKSQFAVRALREVGVALSSTLDLDGLLSLILEKATVLVGADRGTVYLLDESTQRLISHVIVGGETQADELSLGEGIPGIVAKTGKPIAIKDAYQDPRFHHGWDEITGYTTRQVLAVPLCNHSGRTIGVIQVLNKRGRASAFSKQDIALLTSLASQAAVSIDNARLFISVIGKNMELLDAKERLERHVNDLRNLFDLERDMAHADEMENLASAVIRNAVNACGAQAGAMLVDELERGVWLYVIHFDDGISPNSFPPVKRVAVKRGEGIIGACMLRNEPLSIPPPALDMDGTEEPVSMRVSQILGLRVTTAIAVPLEGDEDNSIGALALYNAKHASGFSTDDRALLRLLSANAATAARLFLTRQQRERSDRLSEIGSVLSGVIHDLKSPLSVIHGYVQMLSKDKSPEMREEGLKGISKQLEVIGEMQRQVLEFAKGERTILVRRVYLTQYFEELRSELEKELAETNAKLIVTVENRTIWRFDESKIARAIKNLVRNSVEALGTTDGSITIHVCIENNYLVIRVHDTGHGIAPEIEARLFDSFATSGKRSGTGLGLSIVKEIVDEHDGSIEVKSNSSGTTFWLRIPEQIVSVGS